MRGPARSRSRALSRGAVRGLETARMNPVLQQALERLAEVRAEPGLTPSLALWELRATLRGEAGGGVTSVAADGGCRLEWGSTRARGWRFAVGAGPDARLSAGGRPPGRLALDPQGWEAALSAAEEALREEFRPLMSAADELGALLAGPGGAPAPVAIEIHLRWRAWRRNTAPPRAAEDRGFRLLAGTPTEGSPGSGVEWAGRPGALPPWRGDPDWIGGRRGRIGPTGTTATRDLRPRSRTVRGSERQPVAQTGPLVLLAPAAGWWVHEMAHAALESASRIGPVPARHGLSIVDDPAAGPWPAGFPVDDAGDRAAAAVLWDEAGPHAAVRRGRRRRPSVRDAAEAALSVTRLAGGGGAALDWSDLPEGTPVAAGVKAGRFDPPTGRIALELERVGCVREGIPAPGTGRAVALIDAAAGWHGLRQLASAPVETGVLAACSRIGSVVPVMVGAPTIVLDPVQVIP